MIDITQLIVSILKALTLVPVRTVMKSLLIVMSFVSFEIFMNSAISSTVATLTNAQMELMAVQFIQIVMIMFHSFDVRRHRGVILFCVHPNTTLIVIDVIRFTAMKDLSFIPEKFRKSTVSISMNAQLGWLNVVKMNTVLTMKEALFVALAVRDLRTKMALA